MKKKIPEHPNVHVVFYDGVADFNYECPGQLDCAFARYYNNPKAEDDSCISMRPGQACVNGRAIIAALKKLVSASTNELARVCGGDEL